MTVTDVHKDPAARTMAITSSFDAPIERVWQLWADPRQLERWWGPPTYPATMVDHHLTPGGVVTYYMTSPEGERYHGWWRVLTVEAPRLLEFEDGFGESPSAPAPGMPLSTMRVELTAQDGGGTRMEITSTFPTVEAMEQLLEMGQEEGMVAALGQIDDLLGAGVEAPPTGCWCRGAGGSHLAARSEFVLVAVPHRVWPVPTFG